VKISICPGVSIIKYFLPFDAKSSIFSLIQDKFFSKKSKQYKNEEFGPRLNCFSTSFKDIRLRISISN
jgi:hypothetical protein